MKLIINSDDFGLSKSISDGILDGIAGGVLTSTSVMANMPFAKYAIEKAVEKGIECVGLHTNLTVGKPVIENPNLTDENGVFLYNRKQIDENPKLTYGDVYKEIVAQIQKVKEYSHGKLKLDHIDVHHHLEDNVLMRDAVYNIAKEMHLPVRKQGYAFDLKAPDVCYKDFTIENVNIEAIENMVKECKDTDLIVEIVTHSGYIDDYTKTVTSYLGRDKELEVLTEAKKRGLFDGIELISFGDL